jgi:hypothetical protein
MDAPRGPSARHGDAEHGNGDRKEPTHGYRHQATPDRHPGRGTPVPVEVQGVRTARRRHPALGTDGRYEAQYIDATGNGRSVYARTERDVKRKLRDRLEERDQGVGGEVTAVGGWLEAWLGREKKRPTTMARRWPAGATSSDSFPAGSWRSERTTRAVHPSTSRGCSTKLGPCWTSLSVIVSSRCTPSRSRMASAWRRRSAPSGRMSISQPAMLRRLPARNRRTRARRDGRDGHRTSTTNAVSNAFKQPQRRPFGGRHPTAAVACDTSRAGSSDGESASFTPRRSGVRAPPRPRRHHRRSRAVSVLAAGSSRPGRVMARTSLVPPAPGGFAPRRPL